MRAALNTGGETQGATRAGLLSQVVPAAGAHPALELDQPTQRTHEHAYTRLALLYEHVDHEGQ